MAAVDNNIIHNDKILTMFEVGKKVICIKDHSQGAVRRGDVLELDGIKKSKCCGQILLDVGIEKPTNRTGFWKCGSCGNRTKDEGDIWWFNSCIFAPYDDSLSELTVDALLEQIEETESITL